MRPRHELKIWSARHADWAELRTLLDTRWGGTTMVIDGSSYDLTAGRCLVAMQGDVLRGYACFAELEPGRWELLVIEALDRFAGVGSALLKAIEAACADAGGVRLTLATTNDNLAALRFYQRRGFRLTELRPGAVDIARKLKPAIPVTGEDGIPIRDELVLEKRLS